jgi:L-fuconolactonase
MAAHGANLQVWRLIPGIMKIDSHQHFWRYNEDEFSWINDQMSVIRKDFLPSDLKAELEGSGFKGSIAVQARQKLAETSWLLELATHHSFIRGVVGWVDLCSPELTKQLEMFSSNKKLVGVRHVIHDEPDDNFMLRSDFMKGMEQLRKYGLTYDILIFPKHLPNTLQLIKTFPDQVFVLDHIAKPDIKNQVFSPWKENIEKLAKYSNVYCKMSGMVTEASWEGWKQDDFNFYMETILENFGPNRVMIGSDWPVCTVAASYSEVVGIVQNYIKKLSPAEQNQILGENACKIYNINYCNYRHI